MTLWPSSEKKHQKNNVILSIFKLTLSKLTLIENDQKLYFWNYLCFALFCRLGHLLPLHLLESHAERRADGLVSREEQTHVGVRVLCGRLSHQRVLNERLDNAQLQLVGNLHALQAQTEPGLGRERDSVDCGGRASALDLEAAQVLIDESSDVLVAAALQVVTRHGVNEAHGPRMRIAARRSRRRRGRFGSSARAHLERLEEDVDGLDENGRDAAFVFELPLASHELNTRARIDMTHGRVGAERVDGEDEQFGEDDFVAAEAALVAARVVVVGVDARHEHLHDVGLDVRIGATNGRHGRIDQPLGVGRVALVLAQSLQHAHNVETRGRVVLETLGVGL